MIYSLLGSLVAVLFILSASIAHPQAPDRSATPELLTGDRFAQSMLRGKFDPPYKLRYRGASIHAPRTSKADYQETVDDKYDVSEWTIGNSHDSKSSLPSSELGLRVATHSPLSKRQFPNAAQIGRQFLRIGVVQISTLAYIRYPEFKPEIKNVTEPWVAPLRKMYETIRYKATHDWTNLAEKGHLLIHFGAFRLELEPPDGKNISWVLLQNWSDEALIGLLMFNGVVFTGWRYWANLAGMWIYATLTFREDALPANRQSSPSLASGESH